MPTPRRRAGRLTRVEAARRAERVVEVAANMFLERGFDATSMEAVAEKAGIAKPTLYAWYRDKAELFTAVLRRRIEHFLAPLGRRQHDLEGTDAETALTEIGRHVIAVAWSPGALAVRRIITVQAERFPELERLAHEEGWLAAVKGVARVLCSVNLRFSRPSLAPFTPVWCHAAVHHGISVGVLTARPLRMHQAHDQAQ